MKWACHVPAAGPVGAGGGEALAWTERSQSQYLMERVTVGVWPFRYHFDDWCNGRGTRLKRVNGLVVKDRAEN